MGVGASAGGLEAFRSLLGALRPSDDFALILVQHLDPEHESLLPELLAKRTRMPVLAIEDGQTVERGHIYLIPPAFELDIEGLTLRLRPFDSPRGLRRPIDSFLEALAREHGPDCAGVILSGTGSDGSQGVRAIKEAGGLVFVQEPREARYDGMPRSAMATGAVDMVLPAGDTISVLRDFHMRQTGLVPVLERDSEFIEKVVRNVRYRTGHDFSGYKHGTLLRRITLRMSVLELESPADYLRELVQNRGEAERLFRDLLVNVTSFFRDPEVFEALRTRVIPAILESKSPDDEVRVWVPGCSTGQEAYTIAMLFAEEMSRSDVRPQISIFGTDIDEEAIGAARKGSFPSSIAAEVPQPYLDRYFKATQAGYDMKPEIRDMVRFSIQSLVKDPPFSKLDLITCRNVLIYFDSGLQALAHRVFQYGLRPGGFLMLGTSEGMPAEDPSFAPAATEFKIWRRTSAHVRPLDLPRSFRPTHDPGAHRGAPPDLEVLGMAPVVAQALFDRYVPPFIVLKPDDEIAVIGRGAERFLRVSPGRVSLGARALILPELEPALKRVLTGLALENAPYRRLELSSPGPDLPPKLAIGARILASGERVVTFERADGRLDAPQPGPEDGKAQIVIDDAYVSQLEDELENARQTIRTTVEELETSNEELKSSNEEMMSMNEELQSANEELSTTNDELQSKLRELAQANGDLANFMESTQVATVFVDGSLRLRTFTPEATAWFRFVDQDRGRELADIGTRLDMRQLVAACQRVLSNGEVEELEMATTDGNASVMLRVAPYRSEAVGNGGGVVFSIFDVTKVARYAREAARAEAEIRARAEEIETLYSTSPSAMGLIDSEMRLLRASRRLTSITGVPQDDLIGARLAEIAPEFAALVLPSIRRVLQSGEPLLHDMVLGTSAEAPGERRIWQIDWYPVISNGQTHGVGFNLTDVTQLMVLQADLRRIMRELQHRVKNMLSNVIALVKRAGREQGDPKEIFETLARRIGALANTHNLLTAENWSSTALRDILDLELVRVYGAERVELRGPDLRLNARATLAFGMVLHELATNASKYGAFSNAEGQVTVRWSKTDDGDGELLVLRWQERGGPAVSSPGRQGFGSQLVQSMIEGSLGGVLESRWEPEGLTAVMTVAWEAATEVDYDSEKDPLGHADPLP